MFLSFFFKIVVISNTFRLLLCVDILGPCTGNHDNLEEPHQTLIIIITRKHTFNRPTLAVVSASWAPFTWSTRLHTRVKVRRQLWRSSAAQTYFSVDSTSLCFARRCRLYFDLLVAMTTSGYGTMAARHLQAELPFLPPYRPEVVFLHVLGLSTVPRFDFLAVIIDLSRARLVTSVVTRLVYAAQRVLIRKMADKTSC